MREKRERGREEKKKRESEGEREKEKRKGERKKLRESKKWLLSLKEMSDRRYTGWERIDVDVRTA